MIAPGHGLACCLQQTMASMDLQQQYLEEQYGQEESPPRHQHGPT